MLDVIAAPEKFAKAIQFAIGDSVVCETLDEARQLAYHSTTAERCKAVTLDGSLISKIGLIIGGSSQVTQIAGCIRCFTYPPSLLQALQRVSP